MLQHTGKVNVIGMSAYPENVVDQLALLQPGVLKPLEEVRLGQSLERLRKGS